MSNPVRTAIWSVVGVLLALIAVAAVMAASWTARARDELQSMASEALGLPVQVGSARVHLFPTASVTAEAVQIGTQASPLLSAQQVRLQLALWPLLRRDVRIQALSVSRGTLTLRQDRAGHFNFESDSGQSSGGSLSLERLQFDQVDIDYANDSTERPVRAQGCQLDLHGALGPDGRRLAGMQFSGPMHCHQLQTQQWQLDEPQADLSFQLQQLRIGGARFNAYGGQGNATIDGNYRGEAPIYRVHLALNQFQLARLSRTVTPKPIGSGALDFSTELTLQGRTVAELTRSSNGTASLRGQQLTLAVGDLDQELSRYESTQHFNLVDVGAVLVVGPLGLLVTKGYDFTRVLVSGGGSSQVPALVALWNVDQGVAQARDVALSTPMNRVALTGGLDFATHSYQNVVVALINDQGCARVQQTVHGSFSQPEVDKPNVVIALIGPARHLLHKAEHLLGAGHCQAFYSGSLPPPQH